MSMIERMEHEVELAIGREKNISEDHGYEYGINCYKSALKAFKSLCEDNHSGMSIRFTKTILNRMIDNKALTSIEDTDYVWRPVRNRNQNATTLYQCTRDTSLFKEIDETGHVAYKDVDRVVCVSSEDPNSTWHNGFASSLVHDLYPITMPYYPEDKSYKVVTDEILYNKDSGEDFDTVGYLYCITPDGKKVPLNKYFAEDEDTGIMQEISWYQFLTRKYSDMDVVRSIKELENWAKQDDRTYIYQCTDDFSLEISICYWDKNTPIETAKASLYVRNTAMDVLHKTCMLEEKSVQECLYEAMYLIERRFCKHNEVRADES